MKTPATDYLICTTERTGSSLLCSLLEQTGVAGMQPDAVGGHEYLLVAADTQQHLAPDALGDAVRAALERSRTPNGIGGFKVMMAQLRDLGAGDLTRDTARSVFSPATRFVLLGRLDTLAQAASLTRAVHTQCWSSKEQEAFTGLCLFDFLRLRNHMSRLKRHVADWRRLFDVLGVEPLEITYEELVEDRLTTFRRVLDFVGIDDRDVPLPQNDYFARQADATTERWLAEYNRVARLPGLARAAYVVRMAPQTVAARALTRLRQRRARQRARAAGR